MKFAEASKVIVESILAHCPEVEEIRVDNPCGYLPDSDIHDIRAAFVLPEDNDRHITWQYGPTSDMCDAFDEDYVFMEDYNALPQVEKNLFDEILYIRESVDKQRKLVLS